jgi:hypothetical protein
MVAITLMAGKWWTGNHAGPRPKIKRFLQNLRILRN